MDSKNDIATVVLTEKINSGNISIPCHSRAIPGWLVLLDNIPTTLLVLLGSAIIFQVTAAGAFVFGAYALFSVIWFWAKICPHCHHYATYACPCGYGVISARFFKRRENKSFRKVFRRNIAFQYPNWFVPLSFAVYLLITAYSEKVLYLTISFSIIGFIIIPAVSKFVGCKNCEIREECPWMTKQNREVDTE